MKHRTPMFALLLPLAFPAVALAASPAFDCSKAAHEIEELICQDEELSALDRQMGRVWRQAIKSLPAEEVKFQKAYQRGWIKGRNDCWKAKDKKDCARQSYQRRISELQIISGQVIVPEPFEYRCDGGKYDSLTAYFYKNTPVPVTVLTRINGSLDEQDTAYLTDWNGKQAFVGNHAILHKTTAGLEGTWNGEKIRCRRLPETSVMFPFIPEDAA